MLAKEAAAIDWLHVCEFDLWRVREEVSYEAAVQVEA